MYTCLKEKFDLTDLQINELVLSDLDCQELFKDYETLQCQIKAYESDLELYPHYLELVKELEEEKFQ